MLIVDLNWSTRDKLIIWIRVVLWQGNILNIHSIEQLHCMFVLCECHAYCINKHTLCIWANYYSLCTSSSTSCIYLSYYFYNFFLIFFIFLNYNPCLIVRQHAEWKNTIVLGNMFLTVHTTINTLTSNRLSSAEAWQQLIRLNQRCWGRETFKTRRTRTGKHSPLPFTFCNYTVVHC